MELQNLIYNTFFNFNLTPDLIFSAPPLRCIYHACRVAYFSLSPRRSSARQPLLFTSASAHLPPATRVHFFFPRLSQRVCSDRREGCGAQRRTSDICRTAPPAAGCRNAPSSSQPRRAAPSRCRFASSFFSAALRLRHLPHRAVFRWFGCRFASPDPEFDIAALAVPVALRPIFAH